MTTYLSNNQISEMAEVAFTTYEVAADWAAATRAAAEHAVDEFGVQPRRSAVLLAVKLAKVSWQEAIIQTKAATS